MTYNKKFIFYGFVSVIYSLLFSLPGFSQETTPESLRLPEVVITGIEQIKIQRELPKVTPIFSQPVVNHTMRDHSEKMLQQADRLALTQPQQAEKSYLQAILLDPTNSRAYTRLGAAYQASRQYTMAVEAYRKALVQAADQTEAHYHLGILFESQLQEPQKAIEHYRSYLQLGGMDKRVQRWLRNLEGAETPPTVQEQQQ